MHDFDWSTYQLYEIGCRVKKDLETKHATYTEASQEFQSLRDKVQTIVEERGIILHKNHNLITEWDELRHKVNALRYKLRHFILHQEIDHWKIIFLRHRGLQVLLREMSNLLDVFVLEMLSFSRIRCCFLSISISNLFCFVF